ncbi:MAG TPA: trigger factor [Candidatus Woesebacteria bacterium]|nr:trigger factor [Candidatus Woesebacteria bacterium]HNS94472.1 trigger factor [Candidatus Woesebacteria bacterium]
MYTYTKKQLPKHTVEFTVEIVWDHVEKMRDTTFAKMTENVQAPGFRKGKAPKEIAARYIDPQKLYEQVVRSLLPPIYDELVQKESLKPITSPSVELIEAKDKAPWKLKMIVAQVPEVKLNDYKKHVSKLHKDAQKKNDETPKASDESTNEKATNDKTKKSPEKSPTETDANKPAAHDDNTTTQQNVETKKVATLSEVFSTLLKHTECEVPDLLLQEEVNRKLAQLADDVRKVGLTVEKYLESKKTTVEALRTQFAKDAQEMYQIEFVLAEIAKTEKLEVDKAELEGILAGARTDNEREVAQANMAWYETLLRKQKVIDFLNGL